MVGSFIVGPGEAWMWLEGELLWGYNSDSVCFEINHVFSWSYFCRLWPGGWVEGGILETGGYSLRWGFLTKDSQPLTVEINHNHVSLDRTIEVYRFVISIWMVRSLSFVQEIVKWFGRMQFITYGGDGMSEWYEVIVFCFWIVVIVYCWLIVITYPSQQ